MTFRNFIVAIVTKTQSKRYMKVDTKEIQAMIGLNVLNVVLLNADLLVSGSITHNYRLPDKLLNYNDRNINNLQFSMAIKNIA
jgi:hypothetical protein